MIILRSLVKQFGDQKVLNNLSCTIKEGERIVIVGANGSGKTTLFDVIAGECIPDSGKVIIDDVDCTALPPQQRVQWISRLFQDTSKNTVLTMTVAENLSMALYKGRRVGLRDGMHALESHPTIMQLLKERNLDSLLNKPMGSLSGGQRQIISFIMATLVPPKILLLDEPTAALDPEATQTWLIFAKEFIKCHAITTLLITHDHQLASQFSKTIWTMEQGKLKQE